MDDTNTQQQHRSLLHIRSHALPDITFVIMRTQWNRAAHAAPILDSKYMRTGMIASINKINTGAAAVTALMSSGNCIECGTYASMSCTRKRGAHEKRGCMNPALNLYSAADV